ncbi:MAG: hypothetical protein ACYTDY_01960 [Planctomycetota bacterium]|jgi:hypothetical protein
MIPRGLVIAVGALLTTGTAAEAGDGFLRIGGGRIEVRASWGRHRHPPQRKVWVPGHYESRVVTVWIPGHYRKVHVPAEYQEFCDRYGRVHRVLVRPAHTRKVWVRGHYESRSRRVWIPGHYVLRRSPVPHRGVRHRGVVTRH